MMPTTLKLFNTDEQKTKFKNTTSYRSVVQGTYVNFDDLSSMSVLKWLKNVGLERYCAMKEVVYVDLVKYFYNNWEEVKTAKGIRISTFVKGMRIYLDETTIRDALGFDDPVEGEEHLYARFCNMKVTDEIGEWRYDKCFPTFACDDKVGSLNPYIRILHKIVVECLVPRSGCETRISCKDACIIWHILKRKKIDMPYLIFHSMRRIAHSSRKKALSFGMVITRILAQNMIRFNGEKKMKVSDNQNVINRTRLSFMNIAFVDGNWVTKTKPPVALDTFPLLKGGTRPMNLCDPLGTDGTDIDGVHLPFERISNTELHETATAGHEVVGQTSDQDDSESVSFPAGIPNSVFGESRNVTAKDLKLHDKRVHQKIDKEFKKMEKNMSIMVKEEFKKIERILKEALGKN